ncbi:MAG: hypothetical protein ACYDEY_13525 [Acidimicrobiales bacterium]
MGSFGQVVRADYPGIPRDSAPRRGVAARQGLSAVLYGGDRDRDADNPRREQADHRDTRQLALLGRQEHLCRLSNGRLVRVLPGGLTTAG